MRYYLRLAWVLLRELAQTGGLRIICRRLGQHRSQLSGAGEADGPGEAEVRGTAPCLGEVHSGGTSLVALGCGSPRRYLFLGRVDTHII